MILLDDLKLELNADRKALDELAEVLNIKAAKEPFELQKEEIVKRLQKLLKDNEIS